MREAASYARSSFRERARAAVFQFISVVWLAADATYANVGTGLERIGTNSRLAHENIARFRFLGFPPGDFVIVEPIEEGDKVKAEIVRILYKEQVKYIKEEGKW